MAEAIVLVGGQGTRLRPLTVATPKPMLPCAGTPFLAHLLARLRAAGVTRVLLATSYRAEIFADHFGDGSRFGLDVSYITEQTPLGTGGGIRNAAAQLQSGPDDPVLILNGDVVSGHSIERQVAMHTGWNADVTLHLVRVDDPRAYGCVPTDEDGRVSAFLEKMPEPVTDQINAGCYVFRRSVIDTVPAGQVVSVERETFPGLLQSGAVVMGYVDPSYWLDVGTPAAFVRASVDLVLGRADSPLVPDVDGEALILPGASVAADAKVFAGSSVGDGATVARGAVIDGSVLLRGAVVEAGAVVRDSAVGEGARIGRDTVVDGAVIGDGARIGARNELRAGMRVWCGAVIADGAVRFSTDAAPG